MADPASPFVHGNTTYSSIYEAVLQKGPLNHSNNPCRNLNAYINSVVIPLPLATWLMQSISHLELGHYLLTYLRNLVAANIVYFSTGAIFHYICYWHPSQKKVWQQRPMPSTAIMMDQVKLATSSLFLYSLLPCLDEYLIENGYTKVYYTLDEVGGWGNAILYFILYFTLVEIGIYWVHRTLHTNKILYKYIHMPHHKYNTPAMLSPWASLAFHPIDGILQACPYVVMLPLVPCHYLFHLILLFWTGVWATYIHDAMDFGNVGPIMGSKYHTLHHTHYIYNYGQVFTFCDALWGTLRVPIGPTGSQSKRTPTNTKQE